MLREHTEANLVVTCLRRSQLQLKEEFATLCLLQLKLIALHEAEIMLLRILFRNNHLSP